MKVSENISLKPYNTFGIDVNARYFAEITSVDELRQLLLSEEYPRKFVLSGGSNILLTENLQDLVLYINIKGKRLLWEDDQQVAVKIMAGENWHELVLWALERDYGGIENLSLIPGSVGTAPIQNIGAYGVEIKDVFESCEAMDKATGKLRRFDKNQCSFGYRDSYFKNEGKAKYIITSVNLLLSKKNHRINTSYGAISKQLNSMGISKPTIKDVSDAVIRIRQSKLPDPKVLGNSGSFFKNPVLSADEFAAFSRKFPEVPFYEAADGSVKVPAGWLIEKCGFKGKRFGNTGVHKDQALVLVNYGGALGKEVLKLATKIQDEVKSSFGIELTPEVNIIGA